MHPHRIAAITMLVGAGLGLVTLPASAATAPPGCTTATGTDPALTLSSPTATGSALAPGTNLDVLASWTAPAWAEKATLSLCLMTNGTPAPGASTGFPVVAQDGSFSGAFTVPADTPPGTDICLVGALTGHHSDATPATETSNQLCFRTAAVAPPTTTTTTAAAAPTASTTTTTGAIGATTAGTTSPPARPTQVLPAAASAPAAPAPAPRPELPRTGGSTGALSAVAAAAIGAGSLLRRLGRRRSGTAQRPPASAIG